LAQAPHINPNSTKVTGVFRGVCAEDAEDPLIQILRRLDKFIDELAHGKPTGKVLRG
jgi:hypothetical protein